jgi:translation initiation factor 3 subunit B
MKFETEEEAKKAILLGNGYKLDKSHILSIIPFSDVENYAEVEDEYVEPVIEKFEPKEHLKYWLGDERARDQYALIKSNDVGIYWNSKSDLPELVQLRQNWSESFVTWSPKGSYFVSTHQQGLALWGGPSWKQVVRFLHPNVEHVDFSPNETYAVTFSKKPFLTREGLMHVNFKLI